MAHRAQIGLLDKRCLIPSCFSMISTKIIQPIAIRTVSNSYFGNTPYRLSTEA